MNDNAYAAAMGATAETPPLFGEILLDVWFCVLEKGVGKIPYDPNQHSPAQRRTVVKCDIVPIPESGLNFAMEREFIAEFARDGWLKVTLPSLRNLGVTDLQALHEKYVQAESVKYGTYTKNGEERDLTAPKIVEIYGDHKECFKAWRQANGKPPVEQAPEVDDINEALFGTVEKKSAPNAGAYDTGANGSAPTGTRKTALAFLPAIVRSCVKGNDVDMETLEQKLSETPLLRDHFDVTSPEVMEEVQKALAEPAF